MKMRVPGVGVYTLIYWLYCIQTNTHTHMPDVGVLLPYTHTHTNTHTHIPDVGVLLRGGACTVRGFTAAGRPRKEPRGSWFMSMKSRLTTNGGFMLASGNHPCKGVHRE
jgi:hypothetical protein